jgi:hypothetical protein
MDVVQNLARKLADCILYQLARTIPIVNQLTVTVLCYVATKGATPRKAGDATRQFLSDQARKETTISLLRKLNDASDEFRTTLYLNLLIIRSSGV